MFFLIKSFGWIAAASCLAVLPSTLAQERGGGGMDGGGGDALEDIAKWLAEASAQGPEQLVLPAGLTFEAYRSKMEIHLVPDQIPVTFITPEEENNTDDPELKISGLTSLACRDVVSRKAETLGKIKLLCLTTRFRALTTGRRYKQIHHFYAKLAGIEQDIGEISDFEVSGQLPSYLSITTVTKLSIKKRTIQRSEAPTRNWRRGDVEIDAAYQHVLSEGQRAVVRVSYAGTADNTACDMCDGGSCRTHHYLLEAEAGVGISGQSPFAHLNLRFTPISDQKHRINKDVEFMNKTHLNFLTLSGSREIALGKAGKAKIEIFELYGHWQSASQESANSPSGSFR